ncbi:hypothetical protein EJB05_42643, partial [Eragrostis curvula]
MDNRATSHRRHLVTRSALTQIITLLVLLSHAAMALKAAEAATGARFTAMAVVSGSMEPTFKRGDLLLFATRSDDSPVRVGDVVLYRKPVPDDDDGPPVVVHRVIEVRERRDGGGADILTKGDDNSVDDGGSVLYGGAPYLRRDQVIGKAVGYLPGAGWPAIVFEEAGVDRRAVAGVVGLVALVQIVREAMNA